MAIVAHLVERTIEAGDNDVRDGIHAVVLAIDDLVDTTAAAIQARAVTVLNAQGFNLPTGYFDANRLITATFDAAGDVSVFTDKIAEAIA